MKILTYEDLKPYLTAESRLWTEDDATLHMEGHETIRRAWKKVFGVEHPNTADAVAKTDFGDSGDWIFADGRVSCWACDGGDIHQISDEGMRALGLAAPEPYPVHTPPQAPEGMKWEYRGKAWRSHRCVEYYALEDDGGITHASGPSQGVGSNHYFEAVPVLEATDLFPQTKPIEEALKEPYVLACLDEAGGIELHHIRPLPPEWTVERVTNLIKACGPYLGIPIPQRLRVSPLICGEGLTPPTNPKDGTVPVQELPYPDHTAPQPPEGMKWEYRGYEWPNNGKPTTFYSVGRNSGEVKLRIREVPGSRGVHYFEAVPVPEFIDNGNGISPNPEFTKLKYEKIIRSSALAGLPQFTPPDIAAVNTLLSHGIALLEKWREVREDPLDNSPAIELYGVLTETWIAAAHVFMGSGNNES